MIVPPGLKPGANRRLAGEDVRAGSIVLPAGRRLAAQDVALAAAVGLTGLAVRRRVRVAVFSTGDEIVEPGAPRPAAALFDANRYLLAGLLERLGAASTDLGILPDDPDAARARARGGRPRPRSRAHLRRRLDRRGRPCARARSRPSAAWCSGASPSSRAGRWRWASSPAPIRRRARPSSACRAIRSAVFVTFARVVRPLLLRLAGAAAVPLVALPVRAAFAYRKKAGRREYVRVKLTRAADGAVEAVKHAQEGAGVITSLTETDGLVELPEDATTVEPGSTVGFLSYAALVG